MGGKDKLFGPTFGLIEKLGCGDNSIWPNLDLVKTTEFHC
jgi:hypothetical protein